MSLLHPTSTHYCRCVLAVVGTGLVFDFYGRALYGQEAVAGKRSQSSSTAPPSEVPSIDRDAVERAIRELLDRTWAHPGTDSLPLLSLQPIFSTDAGPQVHFALGLALLKKHKYDESQAEFGRAAGRDGVVYFPAWRAQIWLELLRGHYAEAMREVMLFCTALRAEVATGESDRHEYVTWIGQVAGFLRGRRPRESTAMRLSNGSGNSPACSAAVRWRFTRKRGETCSSSSMPPKQN